MEPNKGEYEHLPQGGITSAPAHIWGQPAGKQLCSSRPGCPGGQQVDQEPAMHSHSQAALRRALPAGQGRARKNVLIPPWSPSTAATSGKWTCTLWVFRYFLATLRSNKLLHEGALTPIQGSDSRAQRAGRDLPSITQLGQW